MRLSSRCRRRRGAVLPLVALFLVILLGMVAMAVDLGLIMMARTQCQNAADAAAMTGARNLTGNTSNNNNYSAAGPAAVAAAGTNSVLSQPVQPSQVVVSIGSYSYSPAAGGFVINPSTKAANDNWTLVRATVNYQGTTFLGKVFGLSTFNASATATAAHRPRDVVLINDFSGSMRFDSMLGAPHGGARVQSMNPEAAYPLFGHYSSTSSAALPYSTDYQVTTGEIMGQSNDFMTTQDGPALVNDFYQDATAYGTSSPAFTSASSGYATTPGGNNYLKITNNTGTTYATDVYDVISSTSRNAAWELDGYAGFPTGNMNGKTDYSSAPFAGYTQGPNYWGKTFFLWPPDPRAGPVTAAQVPTFLTDFGFTAAQLSTPAVQGIYQVTTTTGSTAWPSWTLANLQSYLQTKVGLATTSTQYQQILRLFNRPKCDWRALFFYKTDGVTPVTDNSLLWNTSGGAWYPPRDSAGNDHYRINYNAILNWIANTGPNPFPPRLRAGGVLYYDSIPTSIDNSSFPPTDPNQRFWKEYIDEVLGVQQTGGTASSPVYQVVTANCGYGADYTWGTVQVKAPPAAGGPSMDYKDNPQRPKLHFWFGPMSLIDFTGNYNMSRFWWPGTIHESPTWQCKVGMAAALTDVQNNHPNDLVAQIFFSSPQTANNSSGFYNQVRTPLSQNYTGMQNSLWFAPRLLASSTPEIRPYDNNGFDITTVPRANGGTCYSMPLMLAYNQLSGSSMLQSYASSPAPAGQAGGNGRHGAQKLIVFETDGMVNTTASANFTNAGAYNSYYNIRIKDGTSSPNNEYPTGVTSNVSTATTQAVNIATQICALDTAASPGYSTSRKPALIHCIAFGCLFNATNNSTYKTNALSLLEQLQYIGGQAGGEQATLTTPLQSYKVITGTYNQRIANLQQAFSNIMQDGVQITLVQ
jgi:Flp pilus assembly protein TadG